MLCMHNIFIIKIVFIFLKSWVIELVIFWRHVLIWVFDMINNVEKFCSNNNNFKWDNPTMEFNIRVTIKVSTKQNTLLQYYIAFLPQWFFIFQFKKLYGTQPNTTLRLTGHCNIYHLWLSSFK